MTTPSISDGTPSDTNLREVSDTELLQRMANLCSTVDAHVKEISWRIEVHNARHPETASPTAQQTKRLSAHDMLFTLLGDAIERF